MPDPLITVAMPAVRYPDELPPLYAILFDRERADRLVSTLDSLRQSRVSLINAYKRKRSWQPAARAMAIADVTLQHQQLTELREALCAVHGLRGY